MLYLYLFSIALCINAREGPIQTPIAYPLSVPTKVMDKKGEYVCDLINSKSPQDYFEEPFVHNYSQICWSDNGNANFSYTFRGIQFSVYGRHSKAGKFNLFVDNEDLGEIIEEHRDKKKVDLLFISKIYEYGDHTIRVVGQKGQYFEIFKFSFWPEFNAKRLNISDMSTTGKWVKESDEIGGIREYSEKSSGARKSLAIKASKIWIYGTTDPHFGTLHIKFSSINQIICTKSSHQDCILLYESENIHLVYSMLDIITTEAKPVLLYCIYYLNDHINQSAAIEEGSEQNFLNKKYTNVLPENKQIYVTTESLISEISGCIFSNIELPIETYLIKLDKEILFYENNFEFSTFDNYPAPVFLSQTFHGRITISKCTFIKCKSKENNGNVLNCQGEIDITIECCKFINCGENKSQAIVKSNSNNEHLMNFTNCAFYFDNDIFSCYIFETKSSANLVFDHCIFSKCSIIEIMHKIRSFQFTYNVVNSANYQIIKINYLDYKLNISCNIFKNNTLIDSNFIKLFHDLNEIELFNNTFSGFSTKETYSNLYLERNNCLDSKLIINKCKFINNQNDYSAMGINYPLFFITLKFTNCEFIENICKKGNGGAISVGINYNLSLKNCFFKNNKAFHHGGVLAIYKAKKTEIVSCIFEDNTANYVSSMSSLMNNLKEDGRGGAIYLYPHIYSTKIEKCKFISNSAFDGYAIYIKNNDEKSFVINQNIFNGNYDKNTNTSNKGVITSEMLCLSINKILNSNVFMPIEKNIKHTILCVDQNGKTIIPKQANNKLILVISNTLLIIIIIIFFVNQNNDSIKKIEQNNDSIKDSNQNNDSIKDSNQNNDSIKDSNQNNDFIKKTEQDNTFIFLVLGESALEDSESFNEENVKKYGNYYLSSYAILIKRLAKKHLGINEQHIAIFGKGEEGNFDISSMLPDHKIFVQLTIDEIYETKTSESELNFKLYQNVNDLIISIRSFIQSSHCTDPNIILFLYDHGAELKFLALYFGLLSIPHSSLHIYNDSCKSNSMIFMIENYFAISDIINSFQTRITRRELFFLVKVGKKIYPEGYYSQWVNILSLNKKYFEFIIKDKKNNITFKHLIHSAIENDNQEQLYNELSSIFLKSEIDLLIKIVDCYLSYFNIPDGYKEIYSIFITNIEVIKEILNHFKCTNSQLYEIIKSLNDNEPNFIDIHNKMHQNHSIFTNSQDLSPTFGTIRLNEKKKIIAGSPAMGAFIIESLMNRSLSKNSLDNIKKIAYGNTEECILLYNNFFY